MPHIVKRFVCIVSCANLYFHIEIDFYNANTGCKYNACGARLSCLSRKVFLLKKLVRG